MLDRKRQGGGGAENQGLSRALAVAIEWGLMLLLITTPFVLGCVHAVFYTAMAVGVFSLMILWLVRLLTRRGHEGPSAIARDTSRGWRSVVIARLHRPHAYLCGFLALAIVQTIPLPRGAVKWLSPGRAALDERFRQRSLSVEVVSSANLFGSESQSPPASTTASVADGLPLSVCPHATHGELSKAIAYASAFLLITGCLNPPACARRLVYCIILTGTGLACLGLYQHLVWGKKIYGFWESRFGGVPFGPYVNRNHFAGYMAMVLPFALSQFFVYFGTQRAQGGYRRSPRHPQLPFAGLDALPPALCLSAAVVMVCALFTSLSRGGMMAFIAGTGVFVVALLVRGGSLKTLLVSALVISALLVTGLAMGGAELLMRFDDTVLSPDRAGSRPSLWLHTIRIWLDFPLFGVGLGCFRHMFPLYKAAHVGDLEFLRSHCDYLQALSEVGVLGSLFVFAFLASILAPAFKAIVEADSTKQTWELVGAVAACTAMLAHSLVDFNLQIPANAFLFVVILGLIRNLTKCVRQETSTKSPMASMHLDGLGAAAP